MAFKKLATLDELWSGEKKAVVVDGQRVLLVHIDDAVYAYEDRCVHQGIPLSQGCLQGKTILCSAHHWSYDACSGKGINPSSISLTPYPVILENGDILVDLDLDSSSSSGSGSSSRAGSSSGSSPSSVTQ